MPAAAKRGAIRRQVLRGQEAAPYFGTEAAQKFRILPRTWSTDSDGLRELKGSARRS